MNKIITFLTNDNNIIQQVDNLQPPQNSFAILTDDYDILNIHGNRIQLRDNNKFDFCKTALETKHIENIQKILVFSAQKLYLMLNNHSCIFFLIKKIIV
jgi:hypothetical protein